MTGGDGRLPGATPGDALPHRGPRTVDVVDPPERHETFLVALSLGAAGEVARSAVRHVRTGTEQVQRGWSASRVVAFMSAHAGAELAPEDDAGPTERPARSM